MSQVLQLLIGAFGAVLVATAIVLFTGGGAVAWSGAYPLLIGLVAIGIALFERSRYARSHPPSGTLRPTDERFIDPTSGEVIRVWIDGTGDRRYLPDGEQPQK